MRRRNCVYLDPSSRAIARFPIGANSSIALKQLDPVLAAAIEARLTGVGGNSPDGARAHETSWQKPLAARRRLLLRTPGMVLTFGLALSAGLSLSLTAANPASGLGLGLGMAIIAASAAAAVRLQRRGEIRIRESLTAEELRGFAADPALSRLERTYLDSVARLMENAGDLGETLAADLLTEMNALVAAYRRLQEQSDSVRAVLGGASVAEVEAEATALSRRAAATGDPATRAVLEQSLELCRRRLERGRAVGSVLERIDAQQEVLCQTLASLQSSLAGLQAAPVELRSPREEEFRSSIRAIEGQTRAVEDAVREVLSLSAGA